MNGVTKYAAGSRKVAQRNFELEGRDFRRRIGIADIKQTTYKTLMTGLSRMIYLPIIQLSGDISKAFWRMLWNSGAPIS